MAISLKEQLRILNEGVHYHPSFIFGPKGFSVLKKGKEDTETLKVATQMFYDFYAMELMHRLVGSPIPDPDLGNPKYAGQLTPQQQSKFKRAVQRGGENAVGAMYVPDWADVEEPTMGGAIVPSALRRVVDQVYEEVVIQITNKMLSHLRLTLLQEFRYLTGASGWQHFIRRLVSIYNKNGGKISEEEFKQAVKDKIPSLVGHEDTVKRLLKFFKYYSGVEPDLTDAMPKKETPVPEPEPQQPTELEPEEPEPTAQQPEEPESEMPPLEIPPGADWDEEPYKYSDEVEKTKMTHWLKTHKGISEAAHDSSYAMGHLSPRKISDLRQAVSNSGLTWSDILLAYTRMDWGGGVGGPKWGAGVDSYIKLLANSKTHNIEEMAGILDHIYDLQHNNGALLNKGGMYVSPYNLDRRSKVTSLTRYFKNVSPLIQRLILRVLPYVSSHPEIDKNPEAVTNSPVAPMPPEAAEKLTANKFVKSGYGSEWITQAPFVNKQGGTVQNSYTAKYHTNGMYSIQDKLDTDDEVFETLPDFEKWLGRNSPNFIVPTGQSYYSVPQSKSELDTFFEGKTKIKLDAEKETVLLDECKMVWKPLQKCYQAVFPDDYFKFFAFIDGTFMGYMKSTDKIGGTFNNWLNALGYCKAQTADAFALSADEYAKGKEYIGAPNGAVVSTPPPAPSGSPALPYLLSSFEVSMFVTLAHTKGGNVTVHPNVQTESGRTLFSIMGATVNVASVGKQAILGNGKIYFVEHIVKAQPKERWDFTHFNSAYSFINKYWDLLMQSDAPIKDKSVMAPTPSPYSFSTTPSPEVPLPAPSPSKATYKAHLGIAKLPTHTIRLTAEDEDLLKGVGFVPQMQGGDVWYVHSKTHDVVKFFPNDQAKILLPQGNTKVTVTKNIEDAISWLVSKYTGATVSPIVAAPAPSTQGSKAGMLYEKPLLAAGFIWNTAKSDYVNPNNGDYIKIFPYPKSTYTHGSSGQTKHFNSLPELSVFVKSLPKP